MLIYSLFDFSNWNWKGKKRRNNFRYPAGLFLSLCWSFFVTKQFSLFLLSGNWFYTYSNPNRHSANELTPVSTAIVFICVHIFPNLLIHDKNFKIESHRIIGLISDPLSIFFIFYVNLFVFILQTFRNLPIKHTS